MRNTITSGNLVAYSQCPRKAFLLLCTDESGIPHEYMRIHEWKKRRNQIDYMHALQQTSFEENSHLVTDLNNEGDLVIKAILKTGGLEAYCDVLTQIESSSSSGGFSYEPTIVLGTYSLSKEQVLELAFIDLVFSAKGCRKTVTKYIGVEGYCQKCCRYYSPEEINKFAAAQLFGHGLQSWVVYQRLVLRLPYRLIAQSMEDLFNEPPSLCPLPWVKREPFRQKLNLDYSSETEIY